MIGNKKLIGVLIASLILAVGLLPVGQGHGEDYTTAAAAAAEGPLEEYSTHSRKYPEKALLNEIESRACVVRLANLLYGQEPDYNVVREVLESHWEEVRSYYRGINPNIPRDFSDVYSTDPNGDPWLFASGPVDEGETNTLTAILFWPTTDKTWVCGIAILKDTRQITSEVIKWNFLVGAFKIQMPQEITESGGVINIYHEGCAYDSSGGGYNKLGIKKEYITQTMGLGDAYSKTDTHIALTTLAIAAGVGALVGAVGYTVDHYANHGDEPWDWQEFGVAVGACAVGGGVAGGVGGALGSYLSAGGAVALTSTQEALIGIASGTSGAVATALTKSLVSEVVKWTSWFWSTQLTNVVAE